MAMNYIEKLNNGQPISKVFTSTRKTQYRDLYIVSARKKEALLHYADKMATFLSEWYDSIDDFDNFIYTKIHLGDKYNYIYPSGKLVSPYWSDEMNKMGQILWPICFNGRYNFIRDDGSLLLRKFALGLWSDDSDTLILQYSSIEFECLAKDGHTKFLTIKRNKKEISVADAYSSKSNITDRLFLHRCLFSLSIENLNGKELVSDILGIIRYDAVSVSALNGISDGEQGSMFSVKRVQLNGKEELLLFYDFATIKCTNGYRLLCFSTDSILSDTFENVQVLSSLFIKVQKGGLWNIIDKYGDYVSPLLWFDSVDLMSNGNAIVKKGEQYNFLKSNGILLSSEWYDEILPAADPGKFIVRQNSLYNLIDNNLRLCNQKWQDTLAGIP